MCIRQMPEGGNVGRRRRRADGKSKKMISRNIKGRKVVEMGSTDGKRGRVLGGDREGSHRELAQWV